jgi:hypothetical protein
MIAQEFDPSLFSLGRVFNKLISEGFCKSLCFQGKPFADSNGLRPQIFESIGQTERKWVF